MRNERKVGGAVAAWPVLLALAVPAAASAQERKAASPMTEQEAVALLAEGALQDRFRALETAAALGPRASSELRLAVIDATWAELRGETDTPPDAEAIFDYLKTVTELRDPRAIPLLVETLTMGGENPLADFGAEAFPAVFAAVSDPGEDPSRVFGGLTVLRFMVEDGALTTGQVARVREVARDRLSGSQQYFPVRGAMRLALALGDPELRGIVEMIAADRDAAEALVSPYLSGEIPGVTRDRAWEVDRVWEYARLFLSGGGVDIGPVRRPGSG